MLPQVSSRNLKRLDIILLILFPIVAALYSLVFQFNLLVSIFLYFGLPSVYLSIRTPRAILRTLLFALIFGIPMSILCDYLAYLTHMWYVPTVFPFRLFGAIPIEDILWGVLYVYAIIIFYEHFLDKGKHQLIDKHMKYLVFGLASFMFLGTLTVFFDPRILLIPYPYFWYGLVLWAIPTITFVYKFPVLVSKYLKTVAYFFLVGLLFELTALQLGQWTFLGNNFIGWVEIMNLRFPMEEFLYFIIIGSVAVLAYFEFFDDSVQ